MTVDQVPGPAGSALLGSMANLRRNPLDTYLRARRQYGDVVRFTAGPPGLRTAFYTVFSAEGAQQLLATQASRFRKDHSFYAELRELVGNGLLTSQDAEYLRQRRLIQPLFTRHRINEYAAPMADEAHALVTRWRTASNQVVDVADEMTTLTLRVVLRVILGTDLTAAEQAIRRHFPVTNAYVLRRGFSPVKVPRNWPTPGNRKVALAKRDLYAICDEIIAQRRQGEATGTDLVSLLSHAVTADGDRLSPTEIRDQVLVFLLAGHETTATSLAFALHLLATHPDVQEKVVAEVQSALGGGTPTAADLGLLPYTAMVVKEAMRLYPAAPIVGRRSIMETIVDDHRIPAGANILVCPWVTHRHPRYWSDPNRFDPERFSVQREAERPRYAWFPFGGGPRACIGQHFSMLESVLTLSIVLREYRLDAVDTRIPVRAGVTLRSTTPMRCRLTVR